MNKNNQLKSKNMAKKKVRTLRYKTMSRNEQAPRAGEITQDKDTIIVHQVSDTEAKAYATDQNGKLLEIVAPSQDDAGGSNTAEGFLEFLKNNLAEVKEIFYNDNLFSVSFHNKTDTPIVFHTESGRKLEIRTGKISNFYFQRATAGQGSELLFFLEKENAEKTFKTSRGIYFGKDAGNAMFSLDTTNMTIFEEVRNLRREVYEGELDRRLQGVAYLGSHQLDAPIFRVDEMFDDSSSNYDLMVDNYLANQLLVTVNGEVIEHSQQDVSTTFYDIPTHSSRIIIELLEE